MDPVEIAQRFSRPSVTCDKRDVEHLHRLAEALRSFFSSRARQYILDHRSDALLVQYGSDCTPLSTKERYEASIGEVRVVRGGRASQEFLVQKCFIETMRVAAICILEVPLPLEDKTAVTHLRVCRCLLQTARELGHEGLAIQFHKYNRALKGLLTEATVSFSGHSKTR